MDQEIVNALNVMKIDVVIIKGKIPGIKKQVELIMDKETFQEWREKAKDLKPKKKLGFGRALLQETGNLIKPNSLVYF